jgi:hypothetical protein
VNKLKVEMVPAILATGDPARVDEPVKPKFRIGELVLIKNHNNSGHNRLPAYIRGKKGKVESDHGVFVFPDTSAHGEGPKPQHVYTVVFESTELWGSQGRKGDRMYADVWDDYMDAVK